MGLVALLSGFALLAPAPAAAQGSVLVSNIGQSNNLDTSGNLFNSNLAFTTGSSATTLTSVDLLVSGKHSDNYTVSIWTGRPGDSGANTISTLINPNITTTAPTGTEYKWRAASPGIPLAANRTYYVVYAIPAGGHGLNLRVTHSNSEDNTSLSGWSIANDSEYRGPNDTGNWSNYNPYLMRLNTGEATPVRQQTQGNNPEGVPAVRRIVSNLDTSHDAQAGGTSGGYLANAFTVPDPSHRWYTVQNVTVDAHSGAGGNLTVGIYEASNNRPSSTQVGGDLTKVGSAASGRIRFDSDYRSDTDRIVLRGGNTYYLRLRYTGSFMAQATNSDSETASRGWTIADSRLSSSNGTSWTTGAQALRFSVYSYAQSRFEFEAEPAEHGNHYASWASNLGYPRPSGNVSAPAQGVSVASKFRTGDSVGGGGYLLDEVEVDFDSGAGNATVAIYTDSSGVPGARVGANLSKTSSGQTGAQTFAPASGASVSLGANTKYWVVANRATGASSFDVRETPGVTTTFGNPPKTREWGRWTGSSGWALGNTVASNSGGTWSTSGTDVLRFKVSAHVSGSVPHSVVTTMGFKYGYGEIHEAGAGKIASNSFTTSGDPTADAFLLHSVVLGFAGNTAHTHKVEIRTDLSGSPNTNSAGLVGELTPQGWWHRHHFFYDSNLSLNSYDTEGGLRMIFDAPVGGLRLDGGSTYHVVVTSKSGTNPKSGSSEAFLALATRKTADALIARAGWSVGPYKLRLSGTTFTTPFPGADDSSLSNPNTPARQLARHSRSLSFAVRATATEPMEAPQSPGQRSWPDAPTALFAEPGDAQVALSWDWVPGSTGYEYELNGDNNWISTGNGINPSVTITGLTNDTEYTIKVRAVLVNQPGDASEPVTATPSAGGGGQQTVPDAVANIDVTHNGTSLSVSWDAPARAETYDVTYYNTSSGVNARAAWGRAGTSLTITCDSRYPGQYENCVDAGAAYTVGVRASNGAGQGAWANSAAASPPAAPASAPDPVAEVRVTHNGTSLAVSWNAPARATHYDVTYTDAAATAWQRAAWNRAGSGIRISGNVDGNAPINGGTSYIVGVRARNAAGESAWTNSAAASRQAVGFGSGPAVRSASRSGAAAAGSPPEPRAAAWLFPSASDAMRTGIVQVANRADAAGAVVVTATDAAGRAYPPLTLALGPGAVARFDSRDLETGNPAIGLTGATGPGTGDWRLAFESGLDIEVRAYVRGAGGHIAAMDATAPADEGGALRLPIFNPASDIDQRSLLRLVNPGAADAMATVAGIDDLGRSPGEAVVLTVPAGAACTLDAAHLESGAGLACGERQRGLGDGHGRWRLAVASDGPLVAMGLLSAPNGRLGNLSGVPAAAGGDPVLVPLLPAGTDPHGRLGLVRVINRSNRAGAVSLQVSDDSGAAYAARTLRLAAGAAVNLDSWDLELGSPAKGLPHGTGAGLGGWRLALSSDGIEFEALAYIQGPDGFLTPVPTAPEAEALAVKAGVR